MMNNEEKKKTRFKNDKDISVVFIIYTNSTGFTGKYLKLFQNASKGSFKTAVTLRLQSVLCLTQPFPFGTDILIENI